MYSSSAAALSSSVNRWKWPLVGSQRLVHFPDRLVLGVQERLFQHILTRDADGDIPNHHSQRFLLWECEGVIRGLYLFQESCETTKIVDADGLDSNSIS